MNHEDYLKIDDEIFSKSEIKESLLTTIQRIKDRNAEKKRIICKNKVDRVKDLFDSINEFFEGSDCDVDAQLFYPVLSYATAEITGNQVTFDSKLLYDVMNDADNLEIAPFSDGTVSLVIGFTGLIRLE